MCMDAALHDVFRASGLLRDLAATLTRLGGTEVLVAVAVVSVYLLRRAGLGWWAAGTPIASLWTCALLTSFLKDLTDRARPEAGMDLSSAAFPSGHASNTTALAVALALVVPQVIPAMSRRTALSAAAVVSLTIGWTRLALGVHWTTDVLAGWVLGTAVAVAVHRAVRDRGTTTAPNPGD